MNDKDLIARVADPNVCTDDLHDALAAALRQATERACTAISPSDQRCIDMSGRWHELHQDIFGSSWRDRAGKRPGSRSPQSNP